MTQNPPISAVPAGVDLAALTAWMDDRDLGRGPIEAVTELAGGTQNILLGFDRGTDRFVLRRPPLHKRPNSDKTMRREAEMLAALASTNVPHPGLIAAEPEADVLGAAFYLMEPIEGFNATTGLLPPHRNDPAIRHRMGLALVEGITALAAVDHQRVGLAEFGRVDGYLERQVPRWRSQLDSYVEHDGYAGPDIPCVDEVGEWLGANLPTDFRPGIIHGDYHLANVMFRPDSGELAAIVDWELTTLGDPLLDLGWVLATWNEPGQAKSTTSVEPWDNFPTSDELVRHYGERSGRDLASLPWYATLACYKLGIILEGTHARACAGKAPKEIGDMLHGMTLDLFDRAQRFMAR